MNNLLYCWLTKLDHLRIQNNKLKDVPDVPMLMCVRKPKTPLVVLTVSGSVTEGCGFSVSLGSTSYFMGTVTYDYDA